MNKKNFTSQFSIVSSFEELQNQTLNAVFNISGHKQVFVTDAKVLVTVNGIPMNGNGVYTMRDILDEIEAVTGIEKRQYTNRYEKLWN